MRKTKEEVKAELKRRCKEHRARKAKRRNLLLAGGSVLTVCLAVVLLLGNLPSGGGEPSAVGSVPSGIALEQSEMVQTVKTGNLDLMAGIKPVSVVKKEIDSAFIQAQMEFAVGLFRESSRLAGEDGVLVSPLSAQLALAMVANGADGQTLAEMEQVLGGGMPIETLNQYISKYVESLPSTEETSLRLNNAIWIKHGFDVQESFLQTNANYYDAPAYQAPFDDKTVEEINNWVNENTDGMIEKVFDDLPQNAVMALVNTLLFDGSWEYAYAEEDVKENTPFTAYDGTERQVTMMYSDESLYLEDDNAKGFIRHYVGKEYALAVLLPDEGTDVLDYVESLTAERLLKVLNTPSLSAVRAGLPQFESSSSVELNSALQSMGMPSAFFANTANFDNLVGEIADGRFYISAVKHETAIKVSKEGTKAAAATGVIFWDTCVQPPRPSVILDRPFVYMIIDTKTNLPLFIGVLTDIR